MATIIDQLNVVNSHQVYFIVIFEYNLCYIYCYNILFMITIFNSVAIIYSVLSTVQILIWLVTIL